MKYSPDISGKRFGGLVAMRRYKNSKASWECLCDCGSEYVTEYSRLLNKSHYSCGCLKYRKGSLNSGWKGYKGVSKNFFTRIIGNAKKRELPFTITLEYIGDLLEKQNNLCALTRLPICIGPSREDGTTASLDRIDNNFGYVAGNVQWVHKDINQMRSANTVERFIELCKLVSANN